MSQQAEWRRGRRVSVQAPMLIRHMDDGAGGSVSFKERVTGNVSLNGAYFESEEGHSYTVNDVVMASITVPESQRRTFPFARLAGRARVVRVNELPYDSVSNRKRFGVALAFADDLTALTCLSQ